MSKKQRYEIDWGFVIPLLLFVFLIVAWVNGWFLGYVIAFILLLLFFIVPLCIRPKE